MEEARGFCSTTSSPMALLFHRAAFLVMHALLKERESGEREKSSQRLGGV